MSLSWWFGRLRPRRSLYLERLEDRTTPTLSIVSAAPAPVWVPAPLTSLDLTFDAPVNPVSVQTFDLNLLRNGSTFGTVTAAQLVPGTNNQTVRFTLSGLTTAGPLTTYVRPGSIAAANDSTNTNATYTADYVLTALGFSAVGPLGGLIYSGSRSGSTHTFAVDAGQTITLMATAPAPGSVPLAVTLRGPASGTNPGPVLGSATAPGLGAAAVLQTVRAPAAGLYTASVSGGPVTVGPTLKVILNAAQEAEGTAPGPSNNTPATAQDLSAAFTPLTAGAGAPDRAGVSGLFSGSPDHYVVSLQAGQSLSVALAGANPNNRLFNPATVISQVGAAPTDVAVGDLDGNGLPDLVYTLSNPGTSGGTLGVQYGLGNGAFSPGATAPSGGGNPRAVRLADVNRDGKIDAVVANEASGTVGVLFGTGIDPFSTDGPLPSFASPAVYAGGLAARDLAVGDLNGDGWLDVVVGNGYSNVVHVLLNNGDGTFGPTAQVNLGGLTFLTNGVAIGDVTGDSLPDVVAVTVDNPRLAVLPGDGTGRFTGPAIVDMLGGSNPRDVVLADFNRDGLLDAAVGYGGGGAPSLFLNQNNPADPFGLWVSAPSGPLNPGVNKLAAADINGDGWIDLAATFASTALTRVWIGDGVGGFGGRMDLSLNAADGLAAADVNGDGAVDLAVANTGANSVSVLLTGLSRLQVDVVDANGNVLAQGSPAANLSSTVSDFVAPSGGSYYVRVSGAGRTDYAAVVTRGASFDTERNDSAAAAQGVGSSGVLGHVGRAGRLFAVRPSSSSGTPGFIDELDPVTRAVLRTYSAPTEVLSTALVGLAFDGKSLFYMRYGGGTSLLYELDPDTGAVRDADGVSVGSNGVDGLAVLNGKVHLADMAGNQIIGFDPVTDTITHVVPVLNMDLHGGLAGVTSPDRLVATVNTTGASLTRVIEIDPATGVVTAVFATGGAGGTIPNGAARGVAVIAGEIHVSRIDGSPRVDVYSRDGAYLRTLPNLTALSLGGDDLGQSTADWYALDVGFQQRILLGTATPADGPGEFGNAFDPRIELYDPAGALVATGTPGADGRNETIDFTGFSSGTYRVRVTGQNNTGGEYYLAVTSSTAPQPGDDSAGTDEDAAVTIDVLANDSDPDGDTLFIVAVSQPQHGSAALNNDGTITYTPAANYNGNDAFTYTVSDGKGGTATATVNVGVNAVNDAPVALDDAYVTDEDVTLNVPAPGVFANDHDLDAGDRFTYVEYVDAPQHGLLGLSDDGRVLYIPDSNYHGLDQFTYRVRDTQGAFSNLATVRITVRSVNDAPFAGDLSMTGHEDTPITIDIQAITSDVDGDARIVTNLSDPNHGTVVLNADGTVTYTPDANYFGLDSFTYTVSDGNGGSDTGTIAFDLAPINDTPDARPDAYSTDEDTQLVAGAGQGVLANDTDVEGDTLTAVLVAGPYHGVLNLNADGSFTYTPDPNYNGPDEFTYFAKDGPTSGSGPVKVTLTVRAVNDAPVATADVATTDEDVPLTVPASQGVLANDSDADGNSLSAVLVSGPSKGSLTLNADGSFTYTPGPNVNGTDSFTYRASDGSLTSDVVTVTITINPVQDPPVANAGPDQTVTEPATVTFSGSGSDPDGDALTYTWDFGDGGTGSGPSLTHFYADSGTYIVLLTIDDGHGNRASDTLVVTVRNVAPSAGLSGPPSGVRGQVRTFTLTANDVSTVDQAAGFTYAINWGDGSPVQWVQGPSDLQVDHVFAATGTFNVTVTATDKDGGASAPVTAAITVRAAELQGNVLVIGGTTGGDTIVIKPADGNGNLAVSVNGASLGTFRPTGWIVVYAQSGHDTVQEQSAKIKGKTYHVSVPSFLFGGDGDDTLDARGSSSDNVLSGGAGADTLWGGGDDLLIGGLGADLLRGGGDDDILIGGTTTFDTDLAALTAILAEWRRTDLSYQARVDRLSGVPGTGWTGPVLNASTVHDDAAVDQLFGEAGLDWFLYTASGPLADLLQDRQAGERTTPL